MPATKAELTALYGRAITKRVSYRKYMGDDCYSYAVFLDGRPTYTGLSLHSAQYQVAQQCAALYDATQPPPRS